MRKRKRFEVLTLDMEDYGRATYELDVRLTELGADGWELVAVDNNIAYFQREALE